jgi:hypothetical protein
MDTDTAGAERAELTAAWVEYLGSFDWDYAVDIGSRVPVSVAMGRRRVRCWLRALGPRAYCAVILARGRIEGRLHAHVLLGGVGRRPGTESWVKAEAWRYVGLATVQPYSPRRGVRGGMIAYRVADQDHDPGDLTLIGSLKRYVPRRRR